MTLAAQELSRKDMKVIDVAVKYGSDSKDSFSKAFQKFHGITPSQAREQGASIRCKDFREIRKNVFQEETRKANL